MAALGYPRRLGTFQTGAKSWPVYSEANLSRLRSMHSRGTFVPSGQASASPGKIVVRPGSATPPRARAGAHEAATVRLDAAKRIKAIVKSEHAVGREALAEHLAYDTTMSVAEATAVLAKSPKARAVSAVQDPTQRILASYRSATGRAPQPGATPPSTSVAAGEAITVRILANYRAATGRESRPAGTSPPNKSAAAGDATVSRILANHRAATGGRAPGKA